MRDPVRHGTLFGQLTAHVINGADIDTIPPQVASIADDAYDWSVMQRYDLTTRTLPSNARVIRKPLYVWQEFPRTTAAVSLLLAALFLVVAQLLRSGRRLVRAGRERRQLAQHLLTVQDAERQRIARDLHDDVCQEMSAIAVELDVRNNIAANTASADGPAAARQLRDWLARSDARLDPQAFILAPRPAFEIARAIVGAPSPYPAGRAAALAAIRLMREGFRAGELKITDRELPWLDTMQDAVESLPDAEDAFIARMMDEVDTTRFIPAEYDQ
jgi:hypothetical protein